MLLPLIGEGWDGECTARDLFFSSLRAWHGLPYEFRGVTKKKLGCAVQGLLYKKICSCSSGWQFRFILLNHATRLRKYSTNGLHHHLQNKITTLFNLEIKSTHHQWVLFMERETRLELATSSLARRHSTTELPPHIGYCFIIHEQIFFATLLFRNLYRSLHKIIKFVR